MVASRKTRQPSVPFTPEEDALIIKHYSKKSMRAVDRVLGRPLGSVQARVVVLTKRGLLTGKRQFYGRRWTRKEIDFLKERFGLVSDAYICRTLHRSRVGMRLKAKRLGLAKKQNMFTARAVARLFKVDQHKAVLWINDGLLQARKGPWCCGEERNRVWIVTAQELEEFIKHFPDQYDYRRVDRDEYPYWRNLAEWASPKWKTNPLRQLYSKQEVDFIIEHYSRKGQNWVAKQLGRNPESINTKVVKLRKQGIEGLYVEKWAPKPNAWRADEDDFLRENWGALSRDEVSFVLGRTRGACTARASKLGVALPYHTWQPEAARRRAQAFAKESAA